ncbi:MAG: branched-chain amino acid ABC transporter permease [Rhodomicrobium sp.]|nr:branched-chain amino acid ABC transporter permease [Rhodomicrobium sp.]
MSVTAGEERAAGAFPSGARMAGLGWLDPAHILLAFALLVLPALASDFVLFSVFAWALCLGMVALSLMFLAGYGGMVSLAQLTVAGVAGYMVAIFGTNGMNLGLEWPWWAYIPAAIAIATLFATLTGALAVRTAGIYTIMITLAIAAAFFYFTRQNYDVFNGYNGFNLVLPPQLLGIDWRQPVPFYYLALTCAALGYITVFYASRSTFGLALQGIRDNARRMEAVGYNVVLHRIAAYAFAGVIAAVAGVLLVWFNGAISPASVGVGPAIDILIIAIIGGIRHPIGPFIGALIYALLSVFAMDLIEVIVDRERFKLIIGVIFLLIVLFSPDGILGLWNKLKERLSVSRDWK